jgi:cobalt-zinc-cadmium resistance protein CzcA
MANPLSVLVLCGCLVVAGTQLVPRLGSEFLPELNEGSIYVTFTLPPTISLDEGRRLTPTILGLLRKRVPEVTEILSQLGRPEDGTDAKLFNNLEVFILLEPMSQWRSSIHTLDDMIAIMKDNLKEIPGIEANFSQPIRDNVNENISGQQGQVAIKIYGDDVDTLRDLANQTENVIEKVPGVADPGIVKANEEPNIAIAPDRKALARWNLDLGSMQSYIETALSGHAASELWEGEKRSDVTVRFPITARQDLDSIRELRVPLDAGVVVPLSAIAKVGMVKGPAAITRENGKRYVGIRMNVRNRDLGSLVADARAQVEANVKLPVGYTMTWGGEFENQQRAMARLELVLPLSLVLTFFLLFSAFGTVWDHHDQPAGRVARRARRARLRRDDAQRVRGGRLHRAARPGGAQRRARGQRDQRAPRPRRGPVDRHDRRHARTAAGGHDDRVPRVAGPPTRRAVARDRQRDTTPHRGGRGQRYDLRGTAHAARAPGQLLLGGDAA